ncbi:MAG: hypothetical protein ABJB86_06000 [Bacteroidota bacterium]
MKNEQNNQNGRQDQSTKNAATDQSGTGQDINKQPSSSAGNTDQRNPSSSSSQHSNISVGNDGKIGKAHDQWGNNNKTNDQNQQGNNQTKSNETATGPEIDSPVYDTEKTEKKIPPMQGNKDKK